ncbi:MAG: twin-arginine translocation signal domain-containing protein, partial [Gammaproteobacteria bacterium]|nr:twin-arginine translocation signal domain-containing protein [Gammaproteobacteria bacterium]
MANDSEHDSDHDSDDSRGLNRRGFLTGAATGAAAMALPAADAQAQSARDGGSVPAPTAEQIRRDTGDVRPPEPQRA